MQERPDWLKLRLRAGFYVKSGDKIGLRLPHQTKGDHWKNRAVPNPGKEQYHLKSIKKVFKESFK